MDAAGWEFVVPRRFCGPPESGNGGWVSGHAARLAAAMTGEQLGDALPAVTVRLRTPPPLDRPLVVTEVDGALHVADGEHPVLEARAAEWPAEADLPDPVPYGAALAAGAAYEGLVDHPFPTCFACGPARAEGDGLRLQPARMDDTGRYAAAWTPPADVDLETVWAALDCPGGWAAGVGGRPMVLGTMTAQVGRLPEPGEPHVVMAWQRGAEGRKHFSATSLHGPDGAILAAAQATWIAVDPSAVRPAAQAG